MIKGQIENSLKSGEIQSLALALLRAKLYRIPVTVPFFAPLKRQPALLADLWFITILGLGNSGHGSNIGNVSSTKTLSDKRLRIECYLTVNRNRTRAPAACEE